MMDGASASSRSTYDDTHFVFLFTTSQEGSNSSAGRLVNASINRGLLRNGINDISHITDLVP